MEPSTLPFTKMQAIGNDFIVVEESVWPADTDWPALSLRLCDRKFGIGSDGLLLVGASLVADVRMRMFNPDGTEDMCGNGLRCVVRYAVETDLVRSIGTIESIDGVHAFRVGGDEIATEMRPPKFEIADLPVDPDAFPERRRAELSHLGLFVSELSGLTTVDTVNTGTTHSVIWCDSLPDDALFGKWSPVIETARMFPERTSVLWAVVEEPETIRVRIWERGAGETLACGTGACAVAVLAKVRDKLQAPQIHVRSKGGELTVAWDGYANDPIILTGAAETVFSGRIAVDAED